MSNKQSIKLLLEDEARIKDMMEQNKRSLVDFIKIPVKDALENSEELNIEEIVSKVNSKGYDFDTSRIAEVLTHLVKKEEVQFRPDYTYRLNQNHSRNY